MLLTHKVWCWQVCQELERQAGRAKLAEAHGSVDLEYLKNIMLKLYETGKFVMLTVGKCLLKCA